MTTVSVVTAQRGPPTRIERLYLDGDHAYGFTHDYNGPYWRAERWAQVPISKRRAQRGTPETASRATPSTSAAKGGHGDALPEPR